MELVLWPRLALETTAEFKMCMRLWRPAHPKEWLVKESSAWWQSWRRNSAKSIVFAFSEHDTNINASTIHSVQLFWEAFSVCFNSNGAVLWVTDDGTWAAFGHGCRKIGAPNPHTVIRIWSVEALCNLSPEQTLKATAKNKQTWHSMVTGHDTRE